MCTFSRFHNNNVHAWLFYADVFQIWSLLLAFAINYSNGIYKIMQLEKTSLSAKCLNVLTIRTNVIKHLHAPNNFCLLPIGIKSFRITFLAEHHLSSYMPCYPRGTCEKLIFQFFSFHRHEIYFKVHAEWNNDNKWKHCRAIASVCQPAWKVNSRVVCFNGSSWCLSKIKCVVYIKQYRYTLKWWR